MTLDLVCRYFLLFFFCSMLGWLMEVTCKLFQFHRFINRGFLIGPYCPIYGFGAVFVTLLLSGFSGHPVGYHHATCRGLVSHQTGQSGQCGTLHFEIGDLKSVVRKAFNLLILAGVRQRNAELTALRAEESTAGYGDAPYHIVGSYAFYQFRMCVDDVRSRGAQVSAPSQMIKQRAF